MEYVCGKDSHAIDIKYPLPYIAKFRHFTHQTGNGALTRPFVE